jgi:DNA-binding MarR family transcriptional regulator
MPANNIDTKKPLGWYLKEADHQITVSFEEAFDKYCITRFHWMVLRSVSEKTSINFKTHYEEVKYFLSLPRFKGVIDNLVIRGWLVSTEKDTYTFTDKGRQQFEEVSAAYKVKLKQMMKGVSEEEYETTVATLNQIIFNLKKKY